MRHRPDYRVGWDGSRRDGTKVHYVQSRGRRVSKIFRGRDSEARAKKLADRMNADWDRYRSAMVDKWWPRHEATC